MGIWGVQFLLKFPNGSLVPSVNFTAKCCCCRFLSLLEIPCSKPSCLSLLPLPILGFGCLGPAKFIATHYFFQYPMLSSCVASSIPIPNTRLFLHGHGLLGASRERPLRALPRSVHCGWGQTPALPVLDSL